MNKPEQKVGILTFHMAHNYGAMLQAYALETAIRNLGYQCEVIDYRFPYIDSWSRIEWFDDLINRYGVISGSARYINRLLHGYYSPNNMHIRFNDFERNIIHHSEKIYRNKKEIDYLPYDVIVFGSDQIWNSALTDGIAEEYIGGFKTNNGTRKISYAASCGLSDFQEDSRDLYYTYLKDFSEISVREHSFQNTLISRGFDAKWVLDPTMLLSKEDYLSLLNDNVSYKEDYLLVYVFEEDVKMYDAIRSYAYNRGYKIIAIAYKKKAEMHGMDVRTNCGPLDFLSLIYHAKHVITTSFHGVVFSILFQKTFHCIPHPNYHERTDSLLEMFGLQSCNVRNFHDLKDIQIDWDAVNQILKIEKEKSLFFLNQSLSYKAV